MQISRLPFFIEYDLAQAEWVVVAYEANEANMIEVIESGRDPHMATARLSFGATERAIKFEKDAAGKDTSVESLARIRATLPEWWFAEAGAYPLNMTLRQAGKKANHAFNYGEGHKRFAKDNGISERDSKMIRHKYLDVAYSGIALWWESLEFRIKEHHFLMNPLGRKIPIMGPTHGQFASETFKQGYAAIPQSTVHDIVMIGQEIVVREMGDTVDLRSDNHDSLLIQHWIDPRQGIEAAADKIREESAAIRQALDVELTSPTGETYHIGVDGALGLNWAEADSKRNPLGLRPMAATAENDLELAEFLISYEEKPNGAL